MSIILIQFGCKQKEVTQTKVEELNNAELLWRCTKAIGEDLIFYNGHDLDKNKMLCKNLNPEQQISCLNAVDEMNGMGEEMVR